jgi:hypothetical protein
VTFTLADAGPTPAAFVAVTLQLYCTAFVSDATPTGLTAALPARVVSPAAVHVAVYVEIDEPPFDAGAVKVKLALAFPGVPTTFVGAPGTVRGVTLTVPDALPVPFSFIALTLQLYCVPLVRPVTVIGLDAPVPVIATAPAPGGVQLTL